MALPLDRRSASLFEALMLHKDAAVHTCLALALPRGASLLHKRAISGPRAC